jgi:trans-aconitate 2-methyltransferase
MVEFASTQFGPDRWPNLKFQVADAREIGFSNQFDLVVSFNALHWVPDQEVALRAIAKALRPDGIAQLRLVPTGERKSLEAVLEETRRSPKWSSYFKDFGDPYLRLTAEEYAAAAERSALKVLRTNTASKEWDFKNRAAFAAFGSVTFVRWTQRLPDADRMAFVEDVLDRYQAATSGRDNIFLFYQMDITLKRADAA